MEFCKESPAPDCQHCVVRALSLFCGDLNEHEINTFMKIKRGHVYEKNQAIFYEGNSYEGIYVLCSGSVKLVQSSQAGRQQILGIVSPGDLIEKSSLFYPGTHSATAQALERSEVSFFHRDEFLEVLKTNAHLAINLISVLSREVESGRERSRQLVFKSAKERLADILLDLSHKHGIKHNQTTTIQLNLKRGELAEMAGVTQETVVRLLTLLEKEGLVRLAGKKITILNEEKLNQVKG